MAGEVLSKAERDDLRNMGGILTVYSLQKLFDTCDALELRAEAAERDRGKYEAELERTADILRKRTCIKHLKWLGLLEVAAMVESVLDDRDIMVAAFRKRWLEGFAPLSDEPPQALLDERIRHFCANAGLTSDAFHRLNIAADAKEGGT